MSRFDRSINEAARWLSLQAPKTGSMVRSSFSGLKNFKFNRGGLDALDRKTAELARKHFTTNATRAVAEKVGTEQQELLISFTFNFPFVY